MSDRKVYGMDDIPQDVVDAIANSTMEPAPIPHIKDIVKDNVVKFEFYRQQHMYYSVCCNDGTEYTFPVPLDDVMDASLFAQEKAITYMRYIRKALDAGTFVVSGCC